MIKPLLTGAITFISLGMYWPLYRRLVKRKSSTDFSRLTQCCILLIQSLNLVLAVISHAPYLEFVYMLQIGLVGGATYLIFRYHGGNGD